jgi:hypothetical protein
MSAAQHRGAPANPCHAKRWLWLAMAFACAAIVSGCGPKVLYNWDGYEKSLQASYVGHDEATAWSGLEATITSAQQTGRRIPPGACAEYGFLLYKRGQRERAVQYFQQEAQLFPESKPLMDRLVAKVREQAAADTQPPADGGSVQ